MALAKDEATGAGRGRNLDTHPPGKVLYRSDFDTGFDGWTNHWSGYRPYPIISRTSEICLRGSHSLMLSTGEHASPVSNDVSNGCSAFKRLARHDEYRYHHFSAFLALGVGGFTGSWASFVMMIDTQAWDNSQRSFYQLACFYSAPPVYPKFAIVDNSAGWHDITSPNSHHRIVGNNDNKQNFFYVRLTVDLQANSGLGGYKELQVGPQVFDLTGVGGQSAATAPQTDGTNYITDFNGGFNLGAAITRDPTVTGGCQLFIDDVVYSASNTL
ncbi:hypothetical protein ACXPWS_13575 [Mycobacterium sp. BMJ-28]